MRNPLILIGVLLAGLVLAAILGSAFSRPVRTVTLESFKRVQPGVTKADVDVIFGEEKATRIEEVGDWEHWRWAEDGYIADFISIGTKGRCFTLSGLSQTARR